MNNCQGIAESGQVRLSYLCPDEEHLASRYLLHISRSGMQHFSPEQEGNLIEEDLALQKGKGLGLRVNLFPGHYQDMLPRPTQPVLHVLYL